MEEMAYLTKETHEGAKPAAMLHVCGNDMLLPPQSFSRRVKVTQHSKPGNSMFWQFGRRENICGCNQSILYRLKMSYTATLLCRRVEPKKLLAVTV